MSRDTDKIKVSRKVVSHTSNKVWMKYVGSEWKQETQ